MGVGAFVRRADKVGWQGALYALQRYAGKAVHPGGHTALELWGLAHYLRLGPRRRVDLYGAPGLRLPRWLTQHNWEVDLRYFGTSLLAWTAGMTTLEFGEFSLSVPTPERAILEVLDGVPHVADFAEAQHLMGGLPTLRPALVQTLLEICTSVKVKRLFLYLADATGMPWRTALDDTRLDLGTGKRQIVAGGRLDARYGITVPRDSAT